MRIDRVIIPLAIQTKLLVKHQIRIEEARHVLLNKPRIRFAERGHVAGEDVYAAFGQTFAGRYVAVFFIYKPDSRTAIIISARVMNQKERRRYGRK